MLEADLHRNLRDFTLDITLAAEPGKILALMGENGAGKSTVLNLIAGLLKPETGSIRLNGTVLYKSDVGINMPVESRNIGYVLQNSAVFPHMTVAENIAYGMKAQHVPKERIATETGHWMYQMDISTLATVKAGKLSGGQKQRVALARALAADPCLLMLDEPFTALDSESTAAVKVMIREFIAVRRIPCLIVTHRMNDCREIADDACIISKGSIRWIGIPDNLPGMMACLENIGSAR